MATLATMADMLYEAVNTGDVDAVMDLLKKGLSQLTTNFKNVQCSKHTFDNFLSFYDVKLIYFYIFVFMFIK